MASLIASDDLSDFVLHQGEMRIALSLRLMTSLSASFIRARCASLSHSTWSRATKEERAPSRALPIGSCSRTARSLPTEAAESQSVSLSDVN